MKKQTTTIENSYNRFDKEKGYQEIFFRDGYAAQASEHNELQSIIFQRTKDIADTLLKNGDIIQGAQLVVDVETGEVKAEEGKVYIEGIVYDVPMRTFQIPTSGSVAVGIYLVEKIISEMEDPALYNPAVGSPTQGQAGAWRKQIKAQWGFDSDASKDNFFVVHVVDDGVVRSKEAPPNLDSFNQGIARYDRDSTGGGSYIVSGFVVRSAEDTKEGVQVYTISEGRARVYGYGIETATSKRLSYRTEPDIRLINTEIHNADGSETQRIDVAHSPINKIKEISVTLEKTVQLVHGAYHGVQDALPDVSTVKVLRCVQGETVFEYGTDFKKKGDTVDWSVGGAEPAPGSTYECTYTYREKVEPKNQDYDGFSVENVVADTDIMVTYYQALPRYDRLCLTQDGAFVWQKGVASEVNPRKPSAPDTMLALATVLQTWRETRKIDNDGIRVTSFDDIETLFQRIDSVEYEVARQRLEADASTRESGARVGIFVDPLYDDSCRDQGIEQTAAVISGELTLPISAKVHAMEQPRSMPVSPKYSPTILLAQTSRTSSMRVNPYMVFNPMPAPVTLTPAIDQWTEVESSWTSPISKKFNKTLDGYYHKLRRVENTTSEEVLSKSTKDIEYLRQIDVAFEIKNFGTHEVLQEVTFDGVDVTPKEELIADENGVIKGSFTIPQNIHAGAKTVTFRGLSDGGSFGSAVFIGQGQLTSQVLRQVNVTTNYYVDPLAQTFMVEANSQVCGVDLWFTAKEGQVRVQIRDVQNGVPTRNILAEAIVEPENIIVSGGGHTRITFPVLVQLLASNEYAIVVLCDDATTAVSVANMGDFDENTQKYVSSQPFTVGVMLSSSNASTWTAHQTTDLTFRLLEANFASGTTTYEMGSANIENATDIVMLAVDEIAATDARIEYNIDLPDGNTLQVAQGQTARFAKPVSGKVSVKAKLSGTNKSGPILWPGAQLLEGELSQKADYYSRSVPSIDATRAILIYDALIPSGASVTPEIQIDSGEWEAMENSAVVNQGDGIVEYTCKCPLKNSILVKCRFTLSGTSSARPSIRNIRLLAIK